MPKPYTPSAETAQTLRNIITEIQAQMNPIPLTTKGDLKLTWNAAKHHDIRIVESYLKGEGTFQKAAASVEHRKGDPHV